MKHFEFLNREEKRYICSGKVSYKGITGTLKKIEHRDKISAFAYMIEIFDGGIGGCVRFDAVDIRDIEFLGVEHMEGPGQ